MPPKAVSGVDTNRSVIPSSRRPDGSLRKQIQVKPGFVPVEDQIAFVSSTRIKQMNTVVGGGDRKVKKDESGLSAAALKNLRRKERKQAQAAVPGGSDVEGSLSCDSAKIPSLNGTSGRALGTHPENDLKPVQITNHPETAEIAVEKQIRNLQKKLRKIDELIAKQATGVVLDNDQKQKVSKRKEIEEDLSRLGRSMT